MATEKMTVTRALAELKLIESKIDKAIHGSAYVSLIRGQKTVLDMGIEKSVFEKDAKSNFDSVTTLMKRRTAIKAAILNSNAKTSVKIGDVTMTVAEAIVRKQTISSDVQFLDKMRREWNNIQQMQAQEAARLRASLDKLIETNFSNKNSKPSEEEVKAISDPYTRLNQTTIVDPLNVKDKIAELEKTVEEFQKDVDFILSESNTKTEIEISY